jgi:tetratricopeptide (TPR) repeat protein
LIEWGALGWKLAEPVLRLFGGHLYDRYLKHKIRRDIRGGSRGKIHILLARLADDTPTDSFRTTLYGTIRRELGNAVELTNWPDVEILSDGHEYDIEHRAFEKAQKQLRDHNCDLLISGRVKGRSNDHAVLSLRFTVAEAPGQNPENYKLTDTFDLPANFVGRLGTAIAARVVMSAAPAVDRSGHYIVPLMRATAERLKPLVTGLNLGFDSDTRGSLLFNYGLVLAAIGSQAGSNDELIQAVTAYREALKEYTRERVPLDWAMTQNNLGNALARLGERASDSARLQEAVTAFREALKEYTRERVPLDWAMTQNNLGTALARLGERASDSARLEEAVTAYREALDVFEGAEATHYVEGTRRNLARAEALLAAHRPS